MHSILDYLIKLWNKFIRDDILFLASGIAFNLLICVIPLILIIFAIAGYMLSSSTGLWEKVVVYIQNLIPVSSERIINNTQRLIEDRTLIGIIGLVGMAFTATRLFASLRTVLDYVFEIKHTRGIIHGQLFDFTMLLLMSMIALVANLIFHFLPRLFRESILFNNRIFSLLPLFDSSIVGIVLTFFLTVGLLFISYKFFPSKKMNNDTCLIATLIAAVFIEITKYMYGWFLSMYPQINRVYGTLGAIVALIFWFYISSVVYVAAAEIAFIRESGQRQLLDR